MKKYVFLQDELEDLADLFNDFGIEIVETSEGTQEQYDILLKNEKIGHIDYNEAEGQDYTALMIDETKLPKKCLEKLEDFID